MVWAIILLIITGISFIGVYIDKYKFFKKNGYWYEDCSFKHAALIYSIMSFLAGIFCLIIAIRDYFV